MLQIYSRDSTSDPAEGNDTIDSINCNLFYFDS